MGWSGTSLTTARLGSASLKLSDLLLKFGHTTVFLLASVDVYFINLPPALLQGQPVLDGVLVGEILRHDLLLQLFILSLKQNSIACCLLSVRTCPVTTS